MSYIPDYRMKENYEKLNEKDREFIIGYKIAIDDAICDIENAFDDFDYHNEELLEHIKALIECSHIEAVCSVFEDADYISEDEIIYDVNKLI